MNEKDGGEIHAPLPSKKRIREMKLRADKLAEVLSPTLVNCLNCGSKIKLSHKSEFDNSHWNRHRASCVRRTSAGKRKSTSTASSASSTGSPASSARALTPPDDDTSSADTSLDTEPVPVLELPDWRSWDWSKVKSRFLSPV
ncbi:hypothetical protein C8R45DRAFT_1084978 [Mycena sanguinolenta]|nr:hypothetical protein C8R45DRAFT_1084978 [Mycena sanguinolenta]